MININTARNTVLRLLNKANRGYIGVDEFNNFCKLAQLALFEELFFDYNQFVNRANRRLTNTEYANLPKHLREIIDIFSAYSTQVNFTYNSSDNVWSFSGDDFYRTINLSLVNKTTNKAKDVEEVLKRELNVMINSNVTAPTTTYPAYVKIGDNYRLYPIVSTDDYYLELLYIRTPKDPKWTYTNVGGNPMYNASATDLQHIELPESMFEKFIVKVLLYCGVSIREADVVQIAGNEEVKTEQKQNQ